MVGTKERSFVVEALNRRKDSEGAGFDELEEPHTAYGEE
jgi:hypothetical protein